MKSELEQYIVGTLPDSMELDYDREWEEEELIALSDQSAVVCEEESEMVKLYPLAISWVQPPAMNRGVQYSLPLS